MFNGGSTTVKYRIRGRLLEVAPCELNPPSPRVGAVLFTMVRVVQED